jgi:hypothetical protein
MLDPVSAMAIATSAYNVLKKGIEVGRELEDMGGQLGTWFGAIADVKAADEEAADPPLFRKVFAKSSVEQEAIENLMRRKKIEQQERELREMIVYRFGVDAYRDMIKDRNNIRDARKRAVDARARKIKKLILNAVAIALIALIVAIPIAAAVYIMQRM